MLEFRQGPNRPSDRRFSYEEGRKVRAPMDEALGNTQAFGMLTALRRTDSGTETYRLLFFNRILQVRNDRGKVEIGR